MKSPLITLRGVGKAYPKITSGADRWRAVLSLLKGARGLPHYQILQDIDLDVCQGESLGIIGENGAGKSTLLKIIAGVVKPSAGRIEVTGRIGALLELGAGFHPEYTGRENIRMSAALMGLGGPEFGAKIPSIIEFADIGEYIDQPIKHYSSGMVVRLGFAMVTALQPDILITDEILAVGDESFQKKCTRWIERYLSQGGTLLLCSHNTFHIQKLCRHACWIHHGQVRAYGDSADVTQAYLSYHEEKARNATESPAPLSPELYRILYLHLENAAGDAISDLHMGEDLIVTGEAYSPDDRPPVLLIGIVRADGTPVYGVSSETDGFTPGRLSARTYGFRVRFLQPPLLPGKYTVRVHSMDPEGLRLFHTLEEWIRVRGQSRELGLCRLRHVWESVDASTPQGQETAEGQETGLRARSS